MLLDALAPKASEEGVELVTLEIAGAKKAPTIRVYIDAEQGVGFDELAAANSWIGELMDEIDPFPGAYTLQVSSPGIDRPLRTADHFQRFLGEVAVVKTNGPIDGRSNFTGTIVSVSDQEVILDCDGAECKIPFDAMKRANLKGVINF